MLKLASVAFAAALMVGCAAPSHPGMPLPVETNQVIVQNNNAADALAHALVSKTNAPVVVASAVQIDDLSKSSTFGRAVGEQVAARLANRGVPVVELKLRSSVIVSKEGGELLLSRELKDLTASHKAEVVVVSTYAVAGQSVLVTLKAVNILTNQVLAAHSYSVSRATTGLLLN